MTYEKMTGKINLEELEVQAEEVTEASGSMLSIWLWINTHELDLTLTCWY